ECKDFCIEAGQDLLIEELLMVSDVCITDYSSIIFEYSLLNKPMFFFAYDLEEYYDERGFYYPYEEFVPGPIVKTTKELIQQLHCIEEYDISKIEAFCKQYMSACDGHSTKRILDYAISNE
ncbi:MAG: CDP-glycerol glycerophosphotransferase family protein, partial [Lachnospiraceae bacterium]|nr:CDP-glycerol glycerophosphotransferase family protein [Lachnospiraceae bacterium]